MNTFFDTTPYPGHNETLHRTVHRRQQHQNYPPDVLIRGDASGRRRHSSWECCPGEKCRLRRVGGGRSRQQCNVLCIVSLYMNTWFGCWCFLFRTFVDLAGVHLTRGTAVPHCGLARLSDLFYSYSYPAIVQVGALSFACSRNKGELDTRTAHLFPLSDIGFHSKQSIREVVGGVLCLRAGSSHRQQHQ